MIKTLYEGDDVIVRPPGDIRAIEGCSGAFCECGMSLHIKTPKTIDWYKIKCPVCGKIIQLYCGERRKR